MLLLWLHEGKREVMSEMRWMLSSDQQIPYHDPRVIDLWFKVMKWFKPDVIDYLGDTSDQACWSRWSDNTSSDFMNAIQRSTDQPLIPFIAEQERPVKEFYEQTRKMRPDAEIFSALGNHDIRVWPYFDKKAPDILSEITPEALWGFETLGIDYIHYDDRPKHRYGDIHVHHGMSSSKHSGESVRNDVNDFGVSLVRGHSHRIGTFNRTFPLKNETWRGYEIGHMSDIHSLGMGYQNVHNWQHGFMIGHIIDDWPHLQIIEINSNYECVVDGKKFSA